MSHQGNAPRPPISRRLFVPNITVKPAAIAAALASRSPRRIRNMRRFVFNTSQEVRP